MEEKSQKRWDKKVGDETGDVIVRISQKEIQYGRSNEINNTMILYVDKGEKGRDKKRIIPGVKVI